MTKVAEVLSQPQIEEFYIPVLKRLSNADWFTSRATSAALYAAVYSKISSALQDDLRKAFSALGSDDTPMVRRAAAKRLAVRPTDCCSRSVLTRHYRRRSSAAFQSLMFCQMACPYTGGSRPTIKTPCGCSLLKISSRSRSNSPPLR